MCKLNVVYGIVYENYGYDWIDEMEKEKVFNVEL